MDEHGVRTVTRRSVLKQGAVVGGSAWTAPKLQALVLATQTRSGVASPPPAPAARHGDGSGIISTSDGSGITAAEPGRITAVLANSRLTIYQAGRGDIAAGRIDDHVLRLLQYLSQDHTLAVSSLQTGHSRCVGGGDYPGCRVSHHWWGRAVDISHVDGAPVTPSHEGAYDLVAGLARLGGDLLPREVGSPWAAFESLPGHFSDAAHQDHIHVAYGPSR